MYAYTEKEIFELIINEINTEKTRHISIIQEKIKQEEFNYKQNLVMNSFKIRKELGYHEEVNPSIALSETVQAYVKHFEKDF
jgi:nucleoside-diphosphate-sugar epimerase